MKGFAPLAARPAPTLPTSSFAFIVYRHTNTVRQSVLLPQNGSHPQIPSLLGSHTNKKRHPRKGVFFVGADEGIRTHTVAHRNLKPARLPVPPHPHISCKRYTLAIFCFFSVPSWLCNHQAVPPLLTLPFTSPSSITIAELSSKA